MVIAGVFASEALDGTGEVLDVKGADISDFLEGRGVANYEHRSAEDEKIPASEVVGKVIHAHKVYGKKDCTNKLEEEAWDQIEMPFIWGVVRLYDAAGHPGAINLAAAIRDAHKNKEPCTIGFSIEGNTLLRTNGHDLTNRPDGHVLKRTMARRVAITFRPCNRTALFTLVADPKAPAGFEKFPGVNGTLEQAKKNEDPMYRRLGGYERNYSPEELDKALEAGGYNAAPSALKGGAALQREHLDGRHLRNQVAAAFRDWDRKTPIRKFLKSYLPDVDDAFLEKFADMAEQHALKKAEALLMKKLGSAKKPKAPAPAPMAPEEEDDGPADDGVSPLTIGGKEIPLNPHIKKPYFDEKTGTLHTPRGSFPMYIPGRDKPEHKASFDAAMADPEATKTHDYALDQWMKLHGKFTEGKLPEEIPMHAVMFAQMSPNCLDAQTEALTQRGWIRGFDLRKTDIILTKNPSTGKLEWQGMTDLRLFPDYEGPLVELSSRSFYAVTTPNHRWLTTSHRGHVGEKTSITLNEGDRIHRTGDYEGTETSGLTPDEAELLGWFVTDGHYQRPKSCNGSRAGDSRAKFEQPGIYAFLSQSSTGNAAKCDRIEALLVRLSDETTSRIYKDGKRVWNLGPKLTKMLLARAPERCLTTRALVDLSRSALERLRESMVLGDGHVWRGEGWAGKECLVTGRQEQAEAFQVLLTLTGNASTVVWRDMSKYEPQSEKMGNVPKMTGCYVVTALQREFVRIAESHRRQYAGKVGVWCPVVPNTFFVARRDGKVFVTGNTPVPYQELMYGHMVDAMKHTGVDPRQENLEGLKSDWLSRDSPDKFPEHSPEHWKRLHAALRIKNNSKLTGRKEGDIGSFMLGPNKFKNVEKYHTFHKQLVELLGRHKGDARSAAQELLEHKRKSALHGAKRLREIKAGRPDIGPYTAGPAVAGLAPKTIRYMLGMMGGGNVQVPDTHFSRYLFGLDKAKDSKTIKYLRNQILWNDANSHILNGIDKYYGANHDAVQHMMQHPKYGEYFRQHPEHAIFPAFWKNWMAIVPHERARGMASGGFNEFTDHKPYFEATAPYMKSEKDDAGALDPNDPLVQRTAQQHADWAKKYGDMPAMMMYYKFIVPQLLEHAAQRTGEEEVEKVRKAIALIKGIAAPPRGRLQTDDKKEPVMFQGRAVQPGLILQSDGNAGTKGYSVLGHTPTHWVAVSGAKVDPTKLGPTDLVKIPRNALTPLMGTSGQAGWSVHSYPKDVGTSPVVDADEHGVGEFNTRPAARALIHGLDLDPEKGDKPFGNSAQSRTSWWARNAQGKRVYVKGSEPGFTGLGSARAEGAFYNLAHDVFGLGHYVPTTAVVRHPQTGNEMAVIENVRNGVHHSRTSQDNEQSEQLDRMHNRGDIHRLALMDSILGNDDRHQANYMFTDEEPGLKLIDHGYALQHPGSVMMPAYVSRDHAEAPLHPETSRWLQSLSPVNLEMHMRRHGVPDDVIQNAVMHLKRLQVHNARSPQLRFGDLTHITDLANVKTERPGVKVAS